MRREKSLFRRALEISLLLHLLLIFLIIPQVQERWPTEASAVPLVPEVQNSDQQPLEFEFVDLAEEREETPVSDQVPLSDLDRRAHGGEGDPSQQVAVQGNTPQLVQADGAQAFGSGVPPQQQGQQVPRVPPPQRPQEQPRDQPPQEKPSQPQEEGYGEETSEESAQQPQIQLPPPGAWALPPDEGGLPEMPDRADGGQVDTGGLSFDTQWYDWGPYAKAMLAKIRRHWRIPEIARLGVQGAVRIRFFIERDGTVTGLQILNESGKPPMDFAARDAIADSSAFEPLPPDLRGSDREGVTITFLYNSRRPGRGE